MVIRHRETAALVKDLLKLPLMQMHNFLMHYPVCYSPIPGSKCHDHQRTGHSGAASEEPC